MIQHMSCRKHLAAGITGLGTSVVNLLLSLVHLGFSLTLVSLCLLVLLLLVDLVLGRVNTALHLVDGSAGLLLSLIHHVIKTHVVNLTK